MEKLQRYFDAIEAELSKIEYAAEPDGLYAPVRYELSLGGKRVRPLLTLLACEMFAGDYRRALNAAVGLEVFHNFTLLHDDVMDKADVRRGKPTVHKVWDENTAILSGDAMEIIAFRYIARTEAPHTGAVVELFLKTALEICEGQQYDMEFERRDDVTEAEYIEMIRLKTAVLLGGALKIGAIIGGASETDADCVYRFGESLGLAFQLQDREDSCCDGVVRPCRCGRFVSAAGRRIQPSGDRGFAANRSGRSGKAALIRFGEFIDKTRSLKFFRNNALPPVTEYRQSPPCRSRKSGGDGARVRCGQAGGFV